MDACCQHKPSSALFSFERGRTSCVVVSVPAHICKTGPYFSIYKLPKPVIDDVERKYLAGVIRPFRNRIKHFYKYPCANGNCEAIAAITKDCDYLDFPRFKKGSMYNGMELSRKYSLEELGI